MPDLRSHPMDRLFFAMMAGIGLLSSAIILSVFYLLTASLDHQHAKSGNEKLSLALNDLTNELTTSVQAFVVSDAAQDAIPSREGKISLSKLGLWSDGEGVFDWVAVLDANGQVLVDRNLPQNWDAAGYLRSEAYRPVLEHIAQSAPSAKTSVGGAFERNGLLFLAATARITPRNTADIDTTSLPYFIAGRNLDFDALREISSSIGSGDVIFTTSAAGPSVSVEGPLGFVGNLVWKGELPGSKFRRHALPWVLAICSGLVFLTSWMAAHFRKMANSFKQMHRVARTDHLTGVANRAALTEMIQTPSVKAALRDGNLAVISLDMDDFKKLNDDRGHHAGDTALKIAAKRITNSVQSRDRVFRMGGDEFLCLVLDPDPAGAAQWAVDCLKDAFKTPMDLGGFDHVVTPSIGVAIADRGENWDVVLKRSDADMYCAKRREFTLRVYSN